MRQAKTQLKQVPKKHVKPSREPITFTPKTVRLVGWTLFTLFSFFFLGFYYGDVLKAAESYSLFVYRYEDLVFINQTPLGILYYIGRFLLQFFHIPLLGSAILTTILMTTVVLFDFSLKQYDRLRFLSIALPASFFLFLVYTGFGLFHLSEPSLPMIYAVVMLVVSAALAITKTIIGRFTKPQSEKSSNTPINITQCVIPTLLLLFIAIAATAYPRIGMDIIVHSKMLNSLMDEDWKKLEKLGDNISKHTRSTAAFNAIALAHNEHLANKLFKGSYQYPLEVTKTTGSKFHETMLYFAHCSYHAGLTYSAYYKMMEYATLNGFSPIALKLMTKCALIHGEINLAKKYLHILSKTTFHRDFVAKYEPYTLNSELIETDAEFKKIRALSPIEPADFMQYYRDPIFIGYNAYLLSGRSIQALHNSLAACLYGKLTNEFMQRAEALDRNTTLPIHYQEAIYLFSVLRNQPTYADQYNISKKIKEKTLGFLNEYNTLRDNKKNARKVLYKKYQGTYAFYFFLENLPEDSKKEQEHFKKGVN